jgi:hypothetical protein
MIPKFSIIFLTAAFVTLMHVEGLGQSNSINKLYGEKVFISRPELSCKFQKFSVVKLESIPLSRFLKAKSRSFFSLQLSDFLSWDIDLESSNLISTNYKLKVQTESGLQTISSHSDFLYKGKVRGSEKDEEVRLTIKEGFIYGSIQNQGKEYFIEPLSRFVASGKDEYVVYEAKDVLTTEPFSCGVQDRNATLQNEVEQQKGLREQTPQGSICKRVKFISVADYSIYQKFGSDIAALETALLSNLNLAEGAFTSLNLGPDAATDVGTDKLQFEMEEIVVSVCKECDIVSKTESAPDLGLEMNTWLKKLYPNQGSTIIQLYTQRSLFDLAGTPIGGISFNTVLCDQPVRQILKYLSDDPAFLRMLVAHETGHLLGCRHDDEVKPDVKGFIMDSRSTAASTRLSTLADFGGVSYSSKKTIHDFVNFRNCIADCDDTSCENVKDLSITYHNSSDSITLKWNGTGNFIVKFKEYDSANYFPSNVQEIAGDSITIRNLKSCTIYETEVRKKCNDTKFGPISSIVFNTSSLFISGKPINNHGDSYELQIDYRCKNCSLENYIIKVDKKNFPVERSGQNQFTIKNLFADGARHQIDVSKDSVSAACVNTAFYDAPYYRSKSIKVLNADLNNCTLPDGWKDSLLAKSVVSAPDAHWLIGEKNPFSLSTLRGNFDSTCMIYYNRYNYFGAMYSGAVSLTSPQVDLSKYKDIKLHFDFNFLSGLASLNGAHPSFSVDIFNRNEWMNIFKREADSLPVNGIRRNIWDSLPSRVFIDLNKYTIENTKLRFVADDGSLGPNESGYLFVALDNIQIDGYLKDSVRDNNIVVYPNPTNGELFIRFEQQPSTNINYRIIDVSGRLVMQGLLNNYRIDLNRLSAGMYFLRLYFTNNPSSFNVKVIKR